MLRIINIIIVLMLFVSSPILQADDEYIPDIATFMQIGGAGMGEISPIDGMIYFASSISGEMQIYKITKEGWPYRLTFFDDGINGYNISPDGSKMIVMACRGGNERSQIYLMNPNTGRIKALTDKLDVRFGSVIWGPDSKTIYYYSNEANNRDFYIYAMAVETGQSRLVKDIEGINDPVDISIDGSLLLIEAWPKNVNNELYLLNLESHKIEQLAKHKGDYNFNGGQFSPDNKYIWMVTNKNKMNLKKVAKYNIKKDKFEFINLNSPWETEDMVLSDNRRYLAWIDNENGYGILHIIDTESHKELPAPPLSGIISGPYFGKGSQLIFNYNSPTKTGDLWTWNWQTKKLKQVTFSSYAGINPDIFIEPILIHYKTFDGKEIPAFLFLPPGYKGDVIPFVIHAHGGPEGQYRPFFYRHFQYLLQNGYGILAPNVRGSEGYGREYMTLDDHRKRLDSIKDYKAAADWLIEQGYAKKGKIAIKGTSYGGYVALAAITEYPDYWGASVAKVGISNFKTFLINTADYRRAIREAEYGPLTDSVWLESISPMSKVDNITSPLLLVHGVNDPRVPVDEARQIFHAINNRGGTVDTLIFQDEGHGTAKKENNIAFYRKLIEFFDKHLKY
ncbi:MAG: S9 family peptidase [candidate division Zixibacteria bacterium]|nr:S9 family peptidase [candidate division Zixibacteria bacterium]